MFSGKSVSKVQAISFRGIAGDFRSWLDDLGISEKSKKMSLLGRGITGLNLFLIRLSLNSKLHEKRKKAQANPN